MRRTTCLAVLTVAGVAAAVAANEARQERFGIRQLQLADNLYVLTSDPAEQGMRTGGNTAVFVTASGVTLVDTKIRGYGEDILARGGADHRQPGDDRLSTPTPHWDHSGANTEFPDTVDFVVHGEHRGAHGQHGLRRRRRVSGRVHQESARRSPATTRGSCRGITFATRTSLLREADQIDLYYFGRGHTPTATRGSCSARPGPCTPAT